MSNILAIDTATDTCSLALQLGDERRALHRHMPREHHRQLFVLIDELLEGQAPATLDLDAIAYGRGPGSFTGLRIAASLAQGLAYSLQLRAIGFSSLEAQARGYLRQAKQVEPGIVASAIDARVGEIYCAFYYFDGSTLLEIEAAQVAVPEAIELPRIAAGGVSVGEPLGETPATAPVHLVGSGFAHRASMVAEFAMASRCNVEIVPDALAMLDSLQSACEAGVGENASGAVPDYVQQRSGWKTLAEQGRAV